MTERDLLTAIRADLDDDTPRLACAAWFEENGHPARAEFIRLQCELARLPFWSERRAALLARSEELLQAESGQWLGALLAKPGTGAKVAVSNLGGGAWMGMRSAEEFYYGREPFLELGFCRGFLDEAHCDPRTFIAVADALVRHTPVRRVWLRDDGLETLGQVLACEQLREIPVLALSGHSFGSEGMAVLTDSGGLSRLRGLDLSGNELTPDDVERLAASPDAAGLEVLDLGQENEGGHWDTHNVHNSAGDRGLAAIAGSPHFGNLRRLDLEYNGIGPDGVIALAASRHLRSLRELVLDGNAVCAVGVWALAGARGLGNLETLSLESNDLEADAGPDMFEGDGLMGLRQLNLSNTRLGDRGARALAAAAQFARLRVLNLCGCEIGLEGIQALANCPHLAALTSLYLGFNPLGDEGLKTLARSSFLRNVRTLDLSDCRVGDAGAMALARSDSWHLESLYLGLNAGPDQPPGWPSALPFGVVRNAITGAVLSELRERFAMVRAQGPGDPFP